MKDIEDVDIRFKTANCYMSNPRLKGVGVSLNITKRHLEEYMKCAADPMYFTKKYIKIVSIDHGLVPFKTRPYQERMLSTFHENRFSICKMPRQSGKSTTVVAYFLWFILFHPDKTAGILANKQSLAIDIMDRLKLAYEHLPWFLQQGVISWSKKQIELENGSRCIAGTTSGSSIRGMTLNLVLLDEYAHIPNKIADDFFESVYPTISSGKDSKIIIVSTPKGLNNFYKTWTEAKEGANSYVPIEVHWSEVPGRDDAWKRETIANTSERQFLQEMECQFLGSANTLISGHKLGQLAYRKPIRELATAHTDDKLKVYYVPEPGRAYTMAVDVSEGVGRDAAAFSVFDVTEFPYVQVATYASKNISELLYPDVIRAAAVFYNEATVLIENNTGREVANTLEMDLEYGNIVSVGADKRMGQIAGGGDGKKINNGVKMTKSVKRIGCTTLKTLIEDEKLIINDFDTILELRNFVANKDSFAADGDGHDDLAMTLVLFAWLSVQEYFKEISNMDLRAKLLAEKMTQIEDEVMPMFSPHHNEEAVFQNPNDKKKDIWRVVGEDHSGGADPEMLDVGFSIFR